MWPREIKGQSRRWIDYFWPFLMRFGAPLQNSLATPHQAAKITRNSGDGAPPVSATTALLDEMH